MNAIVKDDCDVDTSELVQILKRIGSELPNLANDANSLAEAVMKADAPADGDTTRQDLVAILMMLLEGKEVPKKHRRVKAFVYGLQMEALNELRGSTGRITLPPILRSTAK